MELEQKIEKLQELTSNALYSLKDAVDAASEEFEQESGTALETSNHLEDIATSLNSVVQLLSLLGYFELVQQGDEPLERL